MKINGSTITITSLVEARKVAYALMEWDVEEHASIGQYAAFIAGIPVPSSIELAVEFATEQVSTYFAQQLQTLNKHQLADVDAALGVELPTSWLVGDAYVNRADYDDPNPFHYLTVLKHIADTGYDQFEFTFGEDMMNVSEVCEVTKLSTGKKFTFYRTIDPCLFDALADHVETLMCDSTARNVTYSAITFIGAPNE